MFRGVEHTAIASPDPRALAEWYAAHLEFVINYEYAGNYFVRASNGTMLEIIPGKGPLAPPQFDDPGIRHLAIDVDDFDAAHAHLQAAGVHFLGEPMNKQGNRLLFFADRDGNILHLIQRERPLPVNLCCAGSSRHSIIANSACCGSAPARRRIGTWMQIVAQSWLVYSIFEVRRSCWASTAFWARSPSCCSR